MYKSEKSFLNSEGVIDSSIEYTVTKIPQEPPYVKLYVNEISRLYDLRSLQKEVLLELATRSGYTGEVSLGPRLKSSIAFRLNTTLPTLDNTLSFLVKKGLMKRVGRGEFLLDPHIFARGDWKDILERRATYKEINSGFVMNFKVKINAKGKREVLGSIKRET